MKVVSMGDRSESGANVVKRLEEALAAAKDGRIENVAIVAIMSDKSVMDGWANGNQAFVMVGGMESLKRDFMDHVIEGRST